jgi:hypothetical protein
MQLRHLQARLRCLQIPPSTRRIHAHAQGSRDLDSLLNIPGIGRAAQEKLANQDVDGVSKLCQLFLDEHARDKDALISYLAVRVQKYNEWLGMLALCVGSKVFRY